MKITEELKQVRIEFLQREYENEFQKALEKIESPVRTKYSINDNNIDISKILYERLVNVSKTPTSKWSCFIDQIKWRFKHPTWYSCSRILQKRAKIKS